MDILENNDQTENMYKVPAVEQAIRMMLCLADNGSTPKSLTNIAEPGSTESLNNAGVTDLTLIWVT